MFALELTSNYCSIRFAAMVAGPQKTFAILIISLAGMEITVPYALAMTLSESGYL